VLGAQAGAQALPPPSVAAVVYRPHATAAAATEHPPVPSAPARVTASRLLLGAGSGSGSSGGANGLLPGSSEGDRGVAALLPPPAPVQHTDKQAEAEAAVQASGISREQVR
jgi:hypothetical protein